MHHPWHDLPLPDDLTAAVPAVIEIPTGSKVKYEIDKKSGMLVVDRILHSAVHYPANYGFVPRTYCGDGDPLDVLVLCQVPVAPMAVMRARLVGVMRMRDDKGEDDKLIAVHEDDPAWADVGDLGGVPRHVLLELEQFFHDYKRLEKGRVEIGKPRRRNEALKILAEAVARYAAERQDLIRLHPPQEPPPPELPKSRRRR